MARPRATVDKLKVTITTTTKVIGFLDELVKTEIYGKTKAEVADELIRRQMEYYLKNPDEWKNLKTGL